MQGCLSCFTDLNQIEDMPLHQLRRTMLGETILSTGMCPTIPFNGCDKRQRFLDKVVPYRPAHRNTASLHGDKLAGSESAGGLRDDCPGFTSRSILCKSHTGNRRSGIVKQQNTCQRKQRSR